MSHTLALVTYRQKKKLEDYTWLSSAIEQQTSPNSHVFVMFSLVNENLCVCLVHHVTGYFLVRLLNAVYLLPPHDMPPTPQFTTHVATYVNDFRLSAAAAPEEGRCPWC